MMLQQTQQYLQIQKNPPNMFPQLTPSTTFDAVIVANGSFPTHETPLSILQAARTIICCDAAAAQVLAAGLQPTAVVGDGDSLADELKEALAARWHQIDEQEYNDLTKAMRHARSLGCRRVAIIGATGKREDHTVGNIFLLPFYLETLGMEPTMLTDYGYFVPACGNATFATEPAQTVSLFNLSCSTLATTGLEWAAYPFAQLWQGTLNRATAQCVSVEANGNYLVYRSY